MGGIEAQHIPTSISQSQLFWWWFTIRSFRGPSWQQHQITPEVEPPKQNGEAQDSFGHQRSVFVAYTQTLKRLCCLKNKKLKETYCWHIGYTVDAFSVASFWASPNAVACPQFLSQGPCTVLRCARSPRSASYLGFSGNVILKTHGYVLSLVYQWYTHDYIPLILVYMPMMIIGLSLLSLIYQW